MLLQTTAPKKRRCTLKYTMGVELRRKRRKSNQSAAPNARISPRFMVAPPFCLSTRTTVPTTAGQSNVYPAVVQN
eukprot:m.83475 g.83475  ORF g.83475 m.83475 type:complete len:75 (+) comp25635_c0_seq1:241-465(+)